MHNTAKKKKKKKKERVKMASKKPDAEKHIVVHSSVLRTEHGVVDAERRSEAPEQSADGLSIRTLQALRLASCCMTQTGSSDRSRSPVCALCTWDVGWYLHEDL